MSPKLGRPFAEDPRKIKVETRMSESELKILDYCCEKTGKTRSEVIRNGVSHTYAVLKDLQEK